MVSFESTLFAYLLELSEEGSPKELGRVNILNSAESRTTKLLSIKEVEDISNQDDCFSKQPSAMWNMLALGHLGSDTDDGSISRSLQGKFIQLTSTGKRPITLFFLYLPPIHFPSYLPLSWPFLTFASLRYGSSNGKTIGITLFKFSKSCFSQLSSASTATSATWGNCSPSRKANRMGIARCLRGSSTGGELSSNSSVAHRRSSWTADTETIIFYRSKHDTCRPQDDFADMIHAVMGSTRVLQPASKCCNVDNSYDCISLCPANAQSDFIQQFEMHLQLQMAFLSNAILSHSIGPIYEKHLTKQLFMDSFNILLTYSLEHAANRNHQFCLLGLGHKITVVKPPARNRWQ